jgi:hypothetical protein
VSIAALRVLRITAVSFLVKASARFSDPHWLIASDDDDIPSWDFGPREKATVFPTRELAETEAHRWKRLLEPALNVTVEAGDGSA